MVFTDSPLMFCANTLAPDEDVSNIDEDYLNSLDLRASIQNHSSMQRNPQSQEPLSFNDHGHQEYIHDSDLELLTPTDYQDNEGADNMDLGKRLTTSIPLNDGYIALGTIRVYHRDLKTYIRGLAGDDDYPHLLIKSGLSKKWIRLDGLSIGTQADVTSLRVYILPEDVDRAHRENIKHFRDLVKYLLKFVDCSTTAWLGDDISENNVQLYQTPHLEKEESLFYIFNTLASPSPNLITYNGSSPGLQAMTDALEDTIVGLKTPLYSYQRRSVAAMIKKEADPARIKDLRKSKFLDMYGNAFYIDIAEGCLLSHRPLYYEPRGGILAETMGYGKTLICLAVILACRGHYASVPHHGVETRTDRAHSTTASLLSMAARQLKSNGFPWKSEFYVLRKAGYHYDRCLKALELHERSYEEPRGGFLNPARRGKVVYSSTISLCSTTLIIVPSNLIAQWKQQIRQHVEEDALDLMVLDMGDQTPPRSELMKCDIVLISKPRFEQEYRDDDVNQGRSIASAGKYTSALTEIRWLRVICDEGHGFAGSPSKTNAMAMLDKMSIERRWVVSGTPSSTLHGVEVSLASNETSGEDKDREESLARSLQQRINPRTRIAEDKDLERLRLIIVNFLKLQPWSNKRGDDKADWKTYLAPKTKLGGVRCSKPALREILQTLIVRHRIQDIDCDLTLPALHNTVTYLEPSYYDTLSINLFVMILTTNYVTSERDDEDYMFHPRNRGTLATLINNLGHATFYWVGITRENVQDTLDNCERYLNKNMDRISDEDGLLLTEAILVARQALNDTGWLAFSKTHEMGTYLTGFPADAKAQWSLDGGSVEPMLMGTSQIGEVKRYMHAQIEKGHFPTVRELAASGTKIMDATNQKAEEESRKRQKRNADLQQTDAGMIDTPRKVPSPNKPHVGRLDGVSRKSELFGESSFIAQDFLNLLGDTKIVGFASAKLAYLCDRLSSHPDEKTIIFYNHNNTAYFLAEALELIQVSFLIYANTLSVAKRAEYLIKFNTDTETKVLLMDLKQAGQGLHVAAASRVYIISPVWDPALESQAIKRAHRIGQTREVFVETLVLKDTFEEILIQRRKEKETESQCDIPSETGTANSAVGGGTLTTLKKNRSSPISAMLEDRVIVKVLKNITFLPSRDLNLSGKMVALSVPVPVFKKDDMKYEVKVTTDTASSPLTLFTHGDPEFLQLGKQGTDRIGPLQESVFGDRSLSNSTDKRKQACSNLPKYTHIRSNPLWPSFNKRQKTSRAANGVPET